MKAIEVTGSVDAQGNLSLDQPVVIANPGRVRVIILYSEELEPEEQDPDDTPLAEVKAGLRKALGESKTGARLPLSQMGDGLETPTNHLNPITQ